MQTSGFFYASELAQTDYGWTGLFTALILAAAVFGVLGFWLGGRIGDLAGRRPMIALGIVLGAAGTVLVFTQVPALFARLLPAGDRRLVLPRGVGRLHGGALPHRVRASLTAFVIVCRSRPGRSGWCCSAGWRPW